MAQEARPSPVTGPRVKIPVVLMHVRMTSIGLNADDLAHIRDDLKVFLDNRADLWGLRVKRRILSREEVTELFASYQARAKMTDEQARARRRELRRKKRTGDTQ